MQQGTILGEPGKQIDHLVFPESGMISLLAVMSDGRSIETVSIGRDGVLGSTAGLGVRSYSGRAVVYLPGTGLRIASSDIRRLGKEHPVIQDTLIEYVENLLRQMFVNAGCNALHSIELRFSRWLLRACDRLESNFVPMTQELLSQVLGVRRASITEAAGHLEVLGLIRRSRGHIEVIDRIALHAASCECTALLKIAGEPVTPLS